MREVEKLEVEWRKVLEHAREISKSKYTLNVPIVHTLEVMADLVVKSEQLVGRLKDE